MIKGILGLIFILILFSFATFPYGGGIAEVEDANPKYQNPNKHFQNLVELQNKTYDSNEWDWTPAYLSMCDTYGKDWKQIEKCYFAYKACENKKPLIIENSYKKYDIFSKENDKEYQECLNLFKPSSWRVRLWYWIGRTFF